MSWHSINLDLWGPMWPNVFAPNFWTLVGVAASHLHLSRLQRKHHDEHMQALRDKS